VRYIKLSIILIIGVMFTGSWTSVSFATVSEESDSPERESQSNAPFSDRVGDVDACGEFVFYETRNDGEYKDWRTDGTVVEEIDTSSENHKSYRTWCANELHLRLSGGQLWRADGPTEARYVVKDISGWTIQVWKNEFYFVSPNDDDSNSLWKSDGTAEGTIQFATFAGGVSSNGRVFDSAGDESALYFMVATGPADDPQIWQTDGTSEGTVVVDEGAVYLSDAYLHATDSDVFVASYSSISKMDDSSATPEWTYEFEPQSVAYPTSIGDTLYFAASDGEHGPELWRSDGTTDGTFMLRDNSLGSFVSTPFALTPVGDELYFVGLSAYDEQMVHDIWKSDGTQAGTSLVKQFATRFDTGNFGLASMNNSLVFWTGLPSNRALWLTGRSVSGTQKIMDFNGIDTDNMVVHNDMFFFSGSNVPGLDIRLWKRDCRGVGTASVSAAATNGTYMTASDGQPMTDAEVSIYLPLIQKPPFVDACVTEPISD